MKYAVLAILMIILAGTFHILFIMFDNAYNNPDTGAFTKLTEVMNKTLNDEYRDRTYNNTLMYKEFFGIGRVITIALAPVLFAIEAFTHKTKIE